MTLREQLHLADYHDRYDNFDLDALIQKGYLSVIGPFAVRGFTYDVCFWLGLKRRAHDATWAGLISHWNLLYVHFTRASSRLYVFLEDLSEGIKFPATGQLYARALKCGLNPD